jgi:hypothetical protein
MLNTQGEPRDGAARHASLKGPNPGFTHSGTDWDIPAHMESHGSPLHLPCPRAKILTMQWILSRSIRMAYAAVAAFSVALVPIACSADTRLDYHVIESREDAIAQVATMCRTGEKGSFLYKFPAGNTAELTASVSPAFSIQIGPNVGVRLTKVPPANPEGVEIVNADVIRPRRIIEDAAEHRRRLEWCDLLVVVGGKPVGVIHGGTGQWEGSLPIGTFESYEAAETVYLGAAGSVDRTVASEAAVERDAQFAAWLDRRDAWAFHCHSETMTAIKSEDPATYERLMGLPKPDCQKQPTPPE